MAGLTLIETVQLEKLLGMDSGYVLNFSNRTFQNFIAQSVGKNIYDEIYKYASCSKANLLRRFWEIALKNDGRLMENDLLAMTPTSMNIFIFKSK